MREVARFCTAASRIQRFDAEQASFDLQSSALERSVVALANLESVTARSGAQGGAGLFDDGELLGEAG